MLILLHRLHQLTLSYFGVTISSIPAALRHSIRNSYECLDEQGAYQILILIALIAIRYHLIDSFNCYCLGSIGMKSDRSRRALNLKLQVHRESMKTALTQSNSLLWIAFIFESQPMYHLLHRLKYRRLNRHRHHRLMNNPMNSVDGLDRIF